MYTDRPRLHAKLLAIPGVVRHQQADIELRAHVPAEAIPALALVIQARRRRTGANLLNALAALLAAR